ncbi:DUF4256 domain-containing protein [Bacteroidota bacterium]
MKKEHETLVATLKARFEKNKTRHPQLVWEQVLNRIQENKSALSSLAWMEETEGEPDVTNLLPDGSIVFMDCSKESPKGRRSYCYDKKALDERKEFKPENAALELATSKGLILLDEADYRYLQTLGEFDLKTSSWILTPAEIRKLGGALFCDRRYNQVFVYHNGASSYYAARGFRCKLHV